MKNQKQLINNIIGQLRGIDKMIEDKADCKKVIIQMKAVRSAMSSTMGKYIKDNIDCCVRGRGSASNLEELIKEITKL